MELELLRDSSEPKPLFRGRLSRENLRQVLERRSRLPDAQACASEFRQYCLDHNLLDFSLQLEIFARILWNDATVRNYLTRSYRHVIYDNVEEDIPVAHDILAEWLPEFDSALLIFDEDAGYRRFLGADPESALELANLCDETVQLDLPRSGILIDLAGERPERIKLMNLQQFTDRGRL